MRCVTPLSISEDEEKELKGLMTNGEKEEYRRCLAVLLRSRGIHPRDVAQILGVARRSVERWVKAYRAHGLDGLKNKPRP
ncbi:MAG: helix-turn-helix domain-containing protein, partial [Thermoprotei archaeon]